MGWQDRDYARDETVGRPGRQVFRRPLLGGRSIVTILIVINVAVYVLGNLGPSLEKMIYGFGAMETRAVMHGPIWRLFTAPYLPRGVGHFLFDLLSLHFLAADLPPVGPSLVGAALPPAASPSRASLMVDWHDPTRPLLRPPARPGFRHLT